MKISRAKKLFFIRYTTVLVMFVVLFIQLILIRAVHISPWKGGGFGMFSTINTPISHIIKAYDYSASGEKRQIIIPAKLKAQEDKILYIAINYYINHFMQAIQKEKWVLKDSEIVNSETLDVQSIADSSNYKPVDLNKISVELWQYKFNAKDKNFYSSFIAQY
jgi:hypothetical protein